MPPETKDILPGGLTTPVAELPGVGEARAKALAKAGVRTALDLLHYYPRDYQYESAETTIGKLKVNTLATARGEVVAVNYTPSPRPRFEATLDDGTGRLALTFFNGAYLRRLIHPGMWLRVKARLKEFRGIAQMQNPKWEECPPPGNTPGVDDKARARFVPIYPAIGRLTSDVIARLVDAALPAILEHLPETLPAGLLARRDLMPRREAYRRIHFPDNKTDALSARRRLVFDELLIMQLGLLISRQVSDGRMTAPVLKCDKLLDSRVKGRFPFAMTSGQLTAVYEILRDLGSGRAMNRLLQGDVGSGKTAVAVYAMLVSVANKLQSALLAPTEVLAEQHYLTLSRFLKDSSVTIELYTSRTRRQSRGGLDRALADGRVHIAVGTQALLQKDIEFANLGLVVVDEQHRLGVKQRATLRGKGLAPHYLVMTATPIPRTLALSYFADFDLSIIDELPPGRTPITTRHIKLREQTKCWDFVRDQVVRGRQAYVVVPKIGEDDGPDDSAGVIREHERLGAGPLGGLRLGILHGRMDTNARQKVMTEFRNGGVDVLVATTVIEVGVDVPNASVMVIMEADRFGLSQLHQLRGRVGRGEHRGYCVLLSDSESEQAMGRLTAMTQTHSGFEIAELDLRLRGPGEFFGTRQHGLPEFRLADLNQETELLADARADAVWLLGDHPMLTSPETRALRAEVAREFEGVLPLASVG
jgi:ATP-dependent DNA helicase RecG